VRRGRRAVARPGSAQVLGFVGRRLLAESIALVFAAGRRPQEIPRQITLAGLPELRLGGLDQQSARALLATVTSGPLDEASAPGFSRRHTPSSALLESTRPERRRPRRRVRSSGRGRILPAASKISTQRAWVSCRTRSSSWSARGGRSGRGSGADPPGGSGTRLDTGTVTWPPRPTCWSLVRTCVRHPWCVLPPTGSPPPMTGEPYTGRLAAVTDPLADPDRRAWHAPPMAGRTRRWPRSSSTRPPCPAPRRGSRRRGLLGASRGAHSGPGERASRASGGGEAKYAAGDLRPRSGPW